ncbi:MAG: S41 family peptidase [Planctomycetota bacterium]|nr:S41 family peptidase [Planctomycetota bacterium]
MFRDRASLRQVLLALLALSVVCFAYADGPKTPQLFLCNPDISPDGTTIAFDHEGDIWTVPTAGGDAKRLTVHVATEKRPYFSPDGSWILYSADYYGNLDLFVIPAKGGNPRRLTYNPGNDLCSGFSSDGQFVYFYSYLDSRFDAFRIRFSGSSPARLLHSPRDNVYAVRPAPEGDDRLLFTYRSSHFSLNRPRIAGPSTSELFLARKPWPAEAEINRLTENDVPDYLPIWKPNDRDSFYFLSCLDGSYNIFTARLSGEKLEGREPLTKVGGKGIRWYSVAKNTGRIVAEIDYRLYEISPETGEQTLIDIDLTTGPKYTVSDTLTENMKVSDYAISPDGKLVAFIAFHEVFITSATGSTVKRLTDTYEREVHLTWDKGTDKLYFNRVVNGDIRAVRLDPRTGEEEYVSPQGSECFTPLATPDGKGVFCQRDYDTIVRIDFESGEVTEVAGGTFARLLFSSGPFFEYSPDHKWLLVRFNNDMMDYDYRALNLETGEMSGIITPLAGSSYYGTGSRDGRFLSFTNYETGKAAVFVLDFAGDDGTESRREKFEKFISGENDEKDKPKKKTYHYDFANARDYTRPLSTAIGFAHYSPVFLPDGRNVVFVGKQDKESLYIVDAASGKGQPRKLIEGSKDVFYPQVSPNGRFVYYIKDGRLFMVSVKGGAQKRITPVSYTRSFERKKAWKAMFEESLWMLENGFYDPGLHGVSIEDIRSRYEPLVASCETEDQLDILLGDMLGEFNASHMGITLKRRSPEFGRADNRNLHPGFFYSPKAAEQGELVVEHVIEGTPAAHEVSGLKPGDNILSFNGIELEKGTNIYRLLAELMGDEMLMRVRDTKGEERNVSIPVTTRAAMAKAVVQEWTENNRKYVQGKSGGRLAYTVVERMYEKYYQQWLEAAKRHLAHCDAMIIDFRYNSGGRIAHKISEVLDDEPWLFKKMRGGRWVPSDLARRFSWQKPVAGVFNYSSTSNTEMMCAAFRIKKLGPSVGTPTTGGVIGTWSRTLVDGSTMRLPRFDVRDLTGRRLELDPTEPEFFVDRTIIHDENGTYPQLDKAIELLLEQVEKTKPPYEPAKAN